MEFPVNLNVHIISALEMLFKGIYHHAMALGMSIKRLTDCLEIIIKILAIWQKRTIHNKKGAAHATPHSVFDVLVGARGFEPPTP